MNFSQFRGYSIIFLIFLGHIVTVSRANLVRRSADPEPEYEFPRDDENAGDDVDNYMEKEFVIESQGENFTVSLGETVRLPCKASSPAVVLLWTKDSIRYSLGLTKLDAPKSVTLENNDLVVHDVKMTDMGTYVCQIAGMPNKSVVHTLNMRPEIVLSRANLVRRSADPEPEHEFLGDPTKDTQNGENTADDVENYISLYDKDVVLESQGQNFTVTLGETVRLPCKASSRAALLSWTKDSISYSLGYMILDAPKSVTLENNDLVVHDVKMTDMGTYVCHIAGMPNKSVVHTLNVEKSPEIVSIHVTDEGILVEGMDVTITCNATGFPKPTLIWTKIISDEEIMKLGIDRAEFGPNSVTIRNVTRSDAGAYACYAINNFNEGRAANITLHVLGKPLVHVHRTVNNSAPNLEVILECTVQGEPLSNIYWLKDGKQILDQYVIEMDEKSSTLKVHPYSAKTVGVFTCVAENSYGRQEETINLLKYPLIDTVTDTLNEKTFRWTVTSYLPLEQTVVTIKERDQVVWRNVSLLVPEANDHTYNVRYVLDRENHKPGNYSAILRVKMDGEWSDSQDLQHIELEPLRDYTVSPMIMNSIRTLCLTFVPGFHAFI